ncbi:MAG: PspC domain-containing protein [Bacteroidetes bacterium]|nr:PspC domain-containing protein [Bacteroidota bacterium]
MNKTISINIGGFVFNIEENAYQKLYHYLNSIRKNFTEEEEREEIMNDIEARIAEIFQSKLSSAKEVILDKDVEEVIEIMGRPEDYVSDEFAQGGQDQSHTKDQAQNQNTSQKRLFRDTENATLGGVCAGLSHYLNIDVTVIRIIFVVLAVMGGSGIFIYLVLLFVIPEAKTTSDRMQMKGQPMNIESIKEHFKKFKDDITENARNGKIRRTFNQSINKGSQIGSTLVKTFSKLIGFAFVVGGSFALVVLFVVLFSSTGILPVAGTEHSENLSTLLTIIYPGDSQGGLVFFAVLIVTLIPILSIIISGIKILFSIKQSFRTIAITSSIIWFLGVAVLVITGINLGMSMRAETEMKYEIPFTDSSNVLLIDVAEDNIFSDHIKYEDVWNSTELIRLKDDQIFLGFPQLYLTKKADSSNFEIILHKKSNGLSNKDAILKAENIEYPVTVSGNRLILYPYYAFPVQDKLRAQEVEVEIKVPYGKKVLLGSNIDRIDLDYSGYSRYDEDSYANTSWKSQPHAMICEGCKERRRGHWW